MTGPVGSAAAMVGSRPWLGLAPLAADLTWKQTRALHRGSSQGTNTSSNPGAARLLGDSKKKGIKL